MLMSILKIAKNLNKILPRKILPQPGFESVFYFIYGEISRQKIISL